MTDDADRGRDHRLDLLILARIAGSGAKTKLTPSKVRSSLGRYAGSDLSPAELKRRIDDRITSLVDRTLLASGPLDVTGEGRKWLCHELGVESVPSWREASRRLFPMLALGLTPGSSEAKRTFSGTDHIQAEILARKHKLPLTKPTLAQVVNALVARALDTHRPMRSANDLRPIVAELWLVDEQWQPDGGGAQRSGGAPGRVEPSLEELAQAVQIAAAGERTGRFGDRKVYISAVFRRLPAIDDRYAGLGMDDFKHRLVEANERHLLTLARADYASAMDPGEIEASHIQHLNSDFHFVLDEQEG